MRQKQFFVIIGLLLGLVACQSTTPSNTALDPDAVMDAYTAAINAHDIDAALALVADDAVYERPNGAYTGKEEIRGFIEGLFARDVQVELMGERQVEGEIVRWTSHVSLTDPENPDGPRVEFMNNSQSTVRDGKIVHHQAERVDQ